MSDVSMTSPSTRPGTATISLTRRCPDASEPRCTTRSTLAATVGTTNAADTFSPASNGSVHILTSASRAELACSVHMPGSPEFKAISRSRHSSWRTSPTISRCGRMRSASFTSRRSGISPLPSRLACLVCIDTTSGRATCNSKTSSTVTTRSRAGMAAHRALSMVVLPTWVPPDTDVQARRHTCLEEAGGLLGQRAGGHQLVQGMQAQDELADVDCHVLAGDLRDDDVQPRTVRQHRVDERRREIDAPAGRPQHPLDELGHLAGGEDQRGELRAAPARDEHAAGLVDPDLLDRPVVEERLQRTEPGDRVEHGTRYVCRIAERRQRRRHRAIEVLTDHIVDQPAHHVRFGDRIDATPADEFANLALDDRRCRAHPVGPIHAKKSQRAYLSSLTRRYHLTTRCGYLRRVPGSRPRSVRTAEQCHGRCRRRDWQDSPDPGDNVQAVGQPPRAVESSA